MERTYQNFARKDVNIFQNNMDIMSLKKMSNPL